MRSYLTALSMLIAAALILSSATIAEAPAAPKAKAKKTAPQPAPKKKKKDGSNDSDDDLFGDSAPRAKKGKKGVRELFDQAQGLYDANRFQDALLAYEALLRKY